MRAREEDRKLLAYKRKRSFDGRTFRVDEAISAGQRGLPCSRRGLLCGGGVLFHIAAAGTATTRPASRRAVPRGGERIGVPPCMSSIARRIVLHRRRHREYSGRIGVVARASYICPGTTTAAQQSAVLESACRTLLKFAAFCSRPRRT